MAGEAEAEAAREDPFPGPPSRGGVMDGIMGMSREATPLGASHSHSHSQEGAEEDDYFPGATPHAKGGEDHFPPPPPVEEEEEEQEEEEEVASYVEDAASPAGDEGDESPQAQEREQEHFPPASAYDEELKAADSEGSQPPDTPPM